MEKEDIVFFGASNLGIQAYLAFKDTFNIIYCCDNDKNKWGTTMLGVPIISPKDLNNIKYSKIIITSMYIKEILIQLTYTLTNEKVKDINVFHYKKIIEEDHNIICSFSIKKITINEINNMFNEVFFDIEKSSILGINITDIQMHDLVHNLCDYFNLTEEEVKKLKLSNYDFIKIVDTKNDFGLFKILYDLGNIAVIKQLIEKELYLLVNSLIDKKDFLMSSVKKMFDSSNLTFVEKAHFYCMISYINSKPYIL